ncbi:MAG: nitrous oxide reductase accessory protein NosL [Desulfuromonadaceae bacterium]
MNKQILITLAFFSTLWGVFAGAEQAPQHKKIQQNKVSVEAPADCALCGMNRTKFNYSRAIVTFEDGSRTGTCSVNCAHDAVSGNAGKKVRRIQVADYGTKQLLDAKTAVWVVGGKKSGVMSPVAKWAFAKKKAAEKYVGEFGGRITGFDDAWKASAGS